jgi:hypothetical protein
MCGADQFVFLEARTLKDRCHVLETLIAFSLQSGGASDEVLQ